MKPALRIAHTDIRRTTRHSERATGRDRAAADAAARARESRQAGMGESPAAIVVLAPLIGLLLWAALFMLVF